MNTELRGVEKRGDDFGYQRHGGPDIDGRAEADRDRIDARKVRDLTGYQTARLQAPGIERERGDGVELSMGRDAPRENRLYVLGETFLEVILTLHRKTHCQVERSFVVFVQKAVCRHDLNRPLDKRRRSPNRDREFIRHAISQAEGGDGDAIQPQQLSSLARPGESSIHEAVREVYVDTVAIRGFAGGQADQHIVAGLINAWG